MLAPLIYTLYIMVSIPLFLRGRYSGVIKALVLSNFMSLVLLIIKMISTHSWVYLYLSWNIFLAWLCLLFAYGLTVHLKNGLWRSWQAVALCILWLGFLPNSFYLSTDLMHLRNSTASTVLFDVTLFVLFMFNGFVSGIWSTFLVHSALLKRFKSIYCHIFIVLVLISCSFGIFLGRSLRWNTWDVIINPAGLLFDISDSFINPSAHPQAFVTTTTFFILIGSVYYVVWKLVKALQSN